MWRSPNLPGVEPPGRGGAGVPLPQGVTPQLLGVEAK